VCSVLVMVRAQTRMNQTGKLRPLGSTGVPLSPQPPTGQSPGRPGSLPHPTLIKADSRLGRRGLPGAELAPEGRRQGKAHFGDSDGRPWGPGATKT
jgi:hypothetical protein